MYITCGCGPFIGYFFNLGEKVSFTETTAEVFSYENQERKTYKLEQFFPPEMPTNCAFLPQKRLKWLKREGYIPVISREQMSFLKHIPTTQKLIKTSDALRLELSRESPSTDTQIMAIRENTPLLELMVTLLDEFRRNVLEENYEAALSCMREASSASNRAFIVRRLLADYLLFLKSPEAGNLYLEIFKHNPAEMHLLEKAILADPKNELNLLKIRKGNYSQEVRLGLCIFGYLASNGECDSYFSKEHTGVEFDPLMLDARIQRAENREKKMQLVRQRGKASTVMSLTEADASPSASPSPSPRKGTTLLRAKNVVKKLTPLTKSTSALLSTFKPKESSRRSLGTVASSEEPAESGAQREQREDYLFQIDMLLQAKKYEEALEKLEFAIRVCQIPTPFYERLLTILPKCSANSSEEECLQKLREDKSLTKEKMQYLIGVQYERSKRYEDGLALAESYIACAQIEKAGLLLFTLAKTDAGSPERVKECLEKMENLGLSPAMFLCERDLKILTLLGLSVNKKYRTSIFKKGSGELLTHSHSGKDSFFCFDHPRYVACWISLDLRILFTKERAEIYFFDESRTEMLPLVIPQAVPDFDRFFMADSIRWLLGKGYKPYIEPDGVHFRLEADAPSPALLLSKAEKIEGLEEFVACIYAKNYGLAHAALMRVEDQKSLCEVYAEFYAFLKRPEAISRFMALGRNSEDALYYVQRALILATENKARETYSIYLKLVDLLQNSHFSDYHAGWICLNAFLYFSCRDENNEYAKAFFEKAPQPFRSLAKVACLHRPRELVIENPEIALRYKAIRQALIEMCRQVHSGNLEEFFTQTEFREKFDAMNMLILEIKNISRTQVDMKGVAKELEQLGVEIAGGEYVAAKQRLFAARDAFLPPETVERKNAYLELENDPDLGSYYRAKNECDDEKENSVLERTFESMSQNLPKIDLKGIFSSRDFWEKLKALETSIPKGHLDELREGISLLKQQIDAGTYREANKTLRLIEEMQLPKTIKERVEELYEVYLTYPRVQTVDEVLSRSSIKAEQWTIFDLKQKSKTLRGAPECLSRFATHLDNQNYEKAELALVRAKNECASIDVKKRLDELYFHFLYLFDREEKTIDFCFEILQEKEEVKDVKVQIGSQREGFFNTICPRVKSEHLYYLEHLLLLAVQKNHPRLPEIYDRIIQILSEKKAPKKHISLVAIHALLHLIDTNPDVAKRYFSKIDIDDPVLHPFARLTLLDRKAKTLRQEQYNSLVRFFENPQHVAAYFDDAASSSLESEIFARCLKIFQCERMYQEKKLALVFVDTLRERGFLQSAFSLIGLVSAKLNSFNIGSLRYSYYLEERLQAGRFSCLKREAVLSLELGNLSNFQTCMQSLERLYEKHHKREKGQLCTKILYQKARSHPAFRALLKILPEGERSSLCLENAYQAALSGYWSDVQESLQNLPNPELLSPDEKLMREVMQSISELHLAQKKLAELNLDAC